MNMTQDQEDRFYDFQDVFAELSVADLEASTVPLIRQWESDWWDYILNGATPGTDRPKDKPDHP
jgi:antirestriction protein ArdC